MISFVSCMRNELQMEQRVHSTEMKHEKKEETSQRIFFAICLEAEIRIALVRVDKKNSIKFSMPTALLSF